MTSPSVPLGLYPVPAADVGAAWPHVVGLIAAAVEPSGNYGAEDIRQALLARDMQLWTVLEADRLRGAAVTEIVAYPRRKWLHGVICIGEGLMEWRDHIATLEAFAKSAGCAGVMLTARPGWEKAVGPLGYRKTHVRLEKEVC